MIILCFQGVSADAENEFESHRPDHFFSPQQETTRGFGIFVAGVCCQLF
jgi:hypothetical protein